MQTRAAELNAGVRPGGEPVIRVGQDEVGVRGQGIRFETYYTLVRICVCDVGAQISNPHRSAHPRTTIYRMGQLRKKMKGNAPEREGVWRCGLKGMGP